MNDKIMNNGVFGNENEKISDEMLENVSGGVVLAVLPKKTNKNTQTSRSVSAVSTDKLGDDNDSNGLYTLENSAGLGNKRIRTL